MKRNISDDENKSLIPSQGSAFNYRGKDAKEPRGNGERGEKQAERCIRQNETALWNF